MNEIEKLFEIGPDGPINREPLIDRGVRYYPKTGHWRRIGSFHKKLPTRISRRSVSEEMGVSESIVEAWEKAMTVKKSGESVEVESLLSIGPEGVVNPQPFKRWGFCFYPHSGIWRRARAARDEVGRQKVAKRVGVSEEAILAWEIAACGGVHSSRGV